MTSVQVLRHDPNVPDMSDTRIDIPDGAGRLWNRTISASSRYVYYHQGTGTHGFIRGSIDNTGPWFVGMAGDFILKNPVPGPFETWEAAVTAYTILAGV